jgi:hypothetical protein
MSRILARTLVFLLTFNLGLGGAWLWHIVRAGFAWSYVPLAMRRVLLDKRDYVEHDMTYKELEAVGAQQRHWTQRVAPAVLPGKGLEHYGLCSDESRTHAAQTAADLAWARAHGQFVPWVEGTHAGHFTAADADETLYELTTGECNARAEWFAHGAKGGTKHFVIYRGDKLYAVATAQLAETIYVVQDTDGDGVDELLLAQANFDFAHKSVITQMKLISLQGGTRRTIYDFGPVYIYALVDDFGNDVVITLPFISYVPLGACQPPEFHIDFYRADCRHNAGCKFWPRADKWQYFKSGQLSERDYAAPYRLNLMGR